MSVLGQALGTQKARKKNDFYPTIDPRAIAALVPHVPPGTIYAEPCAGNGDLIHLLDQAGMVCDWALEIEPQDTGLRNRWPIARGNALQLTAADMGAAQCLISNFPWSRALLHPLIAHLARLRPVWALHDASWAFTKQAKPFERICTDVVAVGRLRWFPPPGRLLRLPGESAAAYAARAKKNRGSDPPDDCAWYRFDARSPGPTRFHFAAEHKAGGLLL